MPTRIKTPSKPRPLKAKFYCAACNKQAATVTFLEAFDDDPRFAEPIPGVPEGVGEIGEEYSRLSIQGGPMEFTVSVTEKLTEVVAAIKSSDALKLFQIDQDFAPFFCYRCSACYCGKHWEIGPSINAPYGSSVYGTCPEGHESRLLD